MSLNTPSPAEAERLFTYGTLLVDTVSWETAFEGSNLALFQLSVLLQHLPG